MKKRCAVVNCMEHLHTDGSREIGLFVVDSNRFERWPILKKYVYKQALSDLETGKRLYLVICSAHFEKKYVRRTPSGSFKVVKGATPTVFTSHTSPSSKRRRSIDIVEPLCADTELEAEKPSNLALLKLTINQPTVLLEPLIKLLASQQAVTVKRVTPSIKHPRRGPTKKPSANQPVVVLERLSEEWQKNVTGVASGPSTSAVTEQSPCTPKKKRVRAKRNPVVARKNPIVSWKKQVRARKDPVVARKKQIVASAGNRWRKTKFARKRRSSGDVSHELTELKERRKRRLAHNEILQIYTSRPQPCESPKPFGDVPLAASVNPVSTFPETARDPNVPKALLSQPSAHDSRLKIYRFGDEGWQCQGAPPDVGKDCATVTPLSRHDDATTLTDALFNELIRNDSVLASQLYDCYQLQRCAVPPRTQAAPHTTQAPPLTTQAPPRPRPKPYQAPPCIPASAGRPPTRIHPHTLSPALRVRLLPLPLTSYSRPVRRPQQPQPVM
ncbi:PREDICTED: uncharacterized protein LOC106807803 [Priapulus caudatus]|uniref:Uncharacterized protein LOC106807803 n=1 Tax=Priapulus caudatus TaxID=37621 RepID=A0ABM1E0M1_PRICU|nr:PREDICTED: uncharacterized protein LOC106807803 [Priapulus caudatus]